jgi:hypothetical protein
VCRERRALGQGVLPLSSLDGVLAVGRGGRADASGEPGHCGCRGCARGKRASTGAGATGIVDARHRPVHAGSPAAAKVAFFAALFGARRDVHALR